MHRSWYTRFLLLTVLLCTPILCASQAFASAQEEPANGWGLYFGLLHSHSALSGGVGTAAEVFSQAATVEGLDFFALTDHSDTFDNSLSGSMIQDASSVSSHWAGGKEAAAAVTGPDFVGIFGYEMAWGNGLGHMNTFCTPGFQSWQQEDFRYFRTGLQNYYEVLTTQEDAIAMFNHPGSLYGHFQNFDCYTEAIDARITLLEVGNGSAIDCSFYDRALEKGWHVAPTNNLGEYDGNWGSGQGRTVVYAHSLTEAGIYDALRNYRVYATEDQDLSIYYSMDGHFMGSRLKKWAVGENADILVTLSDPTDIVGSVEVIAEGQSIDTQMVESGWGTISFSLSPEYRYYYLRITQPDGDIAVTAPIWLEGREYAGISDFSCETSLPVQGETLEVTLELYNQEYTQLSAEQVEIAVDGQPVLSVPVDASLNWGQQQTIPLSLTCDTLGQTKITATVTARLGGSPRSYTREMTLHFRKPELVTDLLIDGTHGNGKSYPQLAALAVNNHVSVTTETGEITAEMLEKTSIFLIPPPERAFESDFLALVKEFVDYGGCLILTGGGEDQNRLLEYLGATIRFSEAGETSYLTTFNTTSAWCANLLPGQLYRCSGSLDLGNGNWIVETALAVEGRIFVGCGDWLSDDALAEPKNIWDPPSANGTIWANILGSTQAQLPLSTIAQVRAGEEGAVYRIRGYATSGSANPHNTFPDTLYIQDDTGGIAIIPFTEGGISIGTPLEITGTLKEEGKNCFLHPISWEVLEATHHRYLPLEGDWHQLMNPALHGGQLVQVEGKVVTFRPTGENGICELIVKDGNGNFATVHIEDSIFSGATGYNDLGENMAVGRTFRAIGIVHMRGDGVSVLRVRNCDEVVYVPRLQYYWEPAKADNPAVGDEIGFWMLTLILSAVTIPILRKRRIM